ncbi:amidase, putative [Trypanosoma equiperdum]|uniref:Amidase, putative n=1 Tax=Trypanosoma equiperdum TaxID=5694 RepID=A0A1G4IAP2_TRYEQ|nr:amidase, putative [Trypanosoma equiperdum]
MVVREAVKRVPKQVVPLHGVCGYAPGCIPAYSNGTDTTFTYQGHYADNFFMGYKWQCVEFARRWLLLRKGLALPQYDFAAHLIHMREVCDAETGEVVPCKFVSQGSPEPPVADALIVYPGTRENIFGHVGVITHVTDALVGVADQNRFFHDWDGRPYAAEFPLECVDGQYFIRDPLVECRGWVTFPERPNRVEGVPLVVSPHVRGPPKVHICKRINYVAGQLWSWCFNRECITFART